MSPLEFADQDLTPEQEAAKRRIGCWYLSAILVLYVAIFVASIYFVFVKPPYLGGVVLGVLLVAERTVADR